MYIDSPLAYNERMKHVQLSPTGVRKYYSGYATQAIALMQNETLRKNIESARSVTLEQDIDAPVKACVMGFALLGCKPRWSCCGFDYEGQPPHKSHTYGTTYFTLTFNESTRTILNGFYRSNIHMKESWKHVEHNQDGFLSVSFYTKIEQREWSDPKSIHYYELGATHLSRLETFLVGLSNSMLHEVTIKDQNSVYRDKFRHWQYPGKEPWTFTKEDFLEEIYGKRSYR